MRHEAPVLLEDVRHAAEQIQRFTAARTLADYEKDDFLSAAVERLFITIGEALSRLERIDANVTGQIAEYRKIIGFRNVLVHGYEAVDNAVVWNVIQQYLPVLKQQVEDLLAGEK